MIDLEKNGKIERQGHKDTLISNHQISDIRLLKSLNLNCNLMVRTNPYNLNSKQEIDEIISNGADTIMLPMFDSIEQVNKISQYINGRVKLNLLFETPKSLILVDRIISECQFDEAHIGLNDLSIAFCISLLYSLRFLLYHICDPFNITSLSQFNRSSFSQSVFIPDISRSKSDRFSTTSL